MRRKMTLFAMCMLGLTACSMNKIETTGSEIATGSTQVVQESQTNSSVKEFHSVDELQNLSETELKGIAEKDYRTEDFISDLSCGEIDLFGVPMTEEERFIFYPLRLEAPVDMAAPLTAEQLQKMVKQYNQNMTSGDTFSNVEVLFCGENEDYLMYSIRYTENREHLSDDSLVSKAIPRAYRIIYPKRECSVQSDAGLCMGIVGELTADTVYRSMDLSSALSEEPIVYRTFYEDTTAYVYEAYSVQLTYGDWGMEDSVCIQKETYTIDKVTHLIDIAYDTLK